MVVSVLHNTYVFTMPFNTQHMFLFFLSLKYKYLILRLHVYHGKQSEIENTLTHVLFSYVMTEDENRL